MLGRNSYRLTLLRPRRGANHERRNPAPTLTLGQHETNQSANLSPSWMTSHEQQRRLHVSTAYPPRTEQTQILQKTSATVCTPRRSPEFNPNRRIHSPPAATKSPRRPPPRERSPSPPRPLPPGVKTVARHPRHPDLSHWRSRRYSYVHGSLQRP